MPDLGHVPTLSLVTRLALALSLSVRMEPAHARCDVKTANFGIGLAIRTSPLTQLTRTGLAKARGC